jgi:chaperonin cofactor prefoldin
MFMPTSTELKSIKGLLRNARELTDDAVNAAQAVGDAALASRLKNISKRMDDELSELERKLTTAEREEKGSGR